MALIMAQVLATLRSLPPGSSTVPSVTPVLNVLFGGLLLRFLFSEVPPKRWTRG